MLDKEWKNPNPKHQITNKFKLSPFRACGDVGRAHENSKQTLRSKKSVLNKPFFGKESFTKEKKIVIFLVKVFAKQKSLFGIVWYLGFRVWNLSPQEIEQMQEEDDKDR